MKLDLNSEELLRDNSLYFHLNAFSSNTFYYVIDQARVPTIGACFISLLINGTMGSPTALLVVRT